jgi:hypothetical protein
MNQEAKRAIKSLVLQLRHKLEDDITIQLKRYGFAGERWVPLSRLPHIEEDNQATIERFRLEAALEQHLRRIGADPSSASAKQRAEAVDWFVREVAFTHLNRLVALKCLEVRELIPEIITTRDAYGGRSRAHRDYRNMHPNEARQPDEALPAAIRDVCRQIYTEFKFLFDVGDPAADQEPPTNTILWPSMPVLNESIALINGLDEEAENQGRTLWAEDEIIGWIDQFYNAEEKEAIRDRGRPRHPAEVAVINQFFTPRWIVKFLVDNTLGRLWLEMHPDSEQVRAKCDYLVPEPLGTEETGGKQDKGTGGDEDLELDPESPINNPRAEPRREAKKPQELRLIDPACGTMHFGHYAFEVFQEIYEDAIERGWAEPPEESIAASILRHNLYGVDIDLRAVQLAGLSLFIKAKSADPDAHVAHLNLVVADAVLPKDGARKRFLARYDDDKIVQDAVRQVLDEMENVAEVGSLLRVEERLRGILGEAGHAAVDSWDADRQRDLPGFEPQARQLSLAETAGARPEEWGAHYTVARLIEDLRDFTAKALQTHDLNAQLFAQEAEKTVHLLDVFLNQYDVVVMNPPYGDPTPAGKRYIVDVYPRTWNDIYGAFIERSEDLTRGAGYTGVLCSRTFMFLSRFERVRRYILRNSEVVALLETGVELLDDATVRPAAVVLDWSDDEKADAFFARLGKRDQDYRSTFTRIVSADWEGSECTYWRQSHRFLRIPRAKWAYWASNALLDLFEDLPSLEPTAGIARAGCSTGDDTQLVRNHWEVDQTKLGKQWRFFNKGGGYSPYYMDYELVINWSPQAVELMSTQGNNLASRQHYFKRAVSWPRISEKGTSFRVQPAGLVFSDKGPVFVPASPGDGELWQHLGLLNSRLQEGVLLALSHERSIDIGSVRSLPYVEPTDSIGFAARCAHDLKAVWDAGNEICTDFKAPWLVQVTGSTSAIDQMLNLLGEDAPEIMAPEAPTVHVLLDAVRAIEDAADARLKALQHDIDEEVYDLYEISERDRRLIKREVGERPPELVWRAMEEKSDKEKRREHVRRLISYFLLQALKEKRDGILPLFNGAGGTTALAEIRRQMAKTFGEEAAFKMESEIKQILGRDIADWLDGPFIKWHTKLYKKCPTIWQLSSDDYHNTFNCFIYYHALDADTLQKVRTQYLWPQRRAIQSALESARRDQREGVAGASSRTEDAEEDLEVLDAFEKKLLSVIEGEAPYTPPDWAEGPIRNGVYDPVLDDGVKVNIMPLQKARILRYKRLV